MITFDIFLNALAVSVNRRPNAGQRQAVEATKGASLFLVAGPGTGKTATLTMRMLKLIFVDGVSPRGILATTFTKKAAQELRSRLLSWGYAVQEHLLNKEKISGNAEQISFYSIFENEAEVELLVKNSMQEKATLRFPLKLKRVTPCI